MLISIYRYLTATNATDTNDICRHFFTAAASVEHRTAVCCRRSRVSRPRRHDTALIVDYGTASTQECPLNVS